MFKIVFWNVEVHMLQNEKVQKHLVRRYKRSVGEQERMVIGQRVRESYVKEDREIREDRDK